MKLFAGENKHVLQLVARNPRLADPRLGIEYRPTDKSMLVDIAAGKVPVDILNRVPHDGIEPLRRAVRWVVDVKGASG